MKLLRIILLLPVPPLPFSSAAGRWFYVLVKGLVERGHNVTSFVVCNELEEIGKVDSLFPQPNYDIRCYLIHKNQGMIQKTRSFQRPYSYTFSPELQRDLAIELVQPYDVFHCEVLWSSWLGLKYKERTVVNVHYLFTIDGIFEHSKSLEFQLRRFITYRAEHKLLKAFPRFIALSERLAKYIHQINPQALVHTVPLGLDFSMYPFREQKQINQQPIVGLIGGFNWTPTYSAAQRLLTRLWPEIKRLVPQAKLQIVGRFAKSALAAFTSIEDLEIYEDVPDILPYFANIDVMLYAPISGSGMKVKIMEAFALGTPVVTTSDGVEGIPADDGIHAGICEDDLGLIARTVELLENPFLQQERRIKARQLLESYCNPQITVTQIEQVYQAMLQ